MKKALFPAAVCAAVLAAAGCHHDTPPITPPVSPSPSPPVVSQPAPRDTAVIYVVNPKATDDQDELMPRTVSLHHSNSPVRDVVKALLAAKGSPLPPGIALRGITVDNSVATLDFSQSPISDTGGEGAQSAALNALGRTLGQFPDIKQYQLEVKGEPVKSMGEEGTLDGPIDVIPSDTVQQAKSAPMSLPQADIGVLNSGLGGLTVLRELQRQMPGASVLYLADTANVPYGDKPIAVVRDLALRLTDYLVGSGVKLVLMASGTSTVAGLDAARERYPHLPIVGTIEPGAQAAAASSQGAIGVLATNATVQSLAFTQAIHALDPGRRVIEQGCPKFVPLVEAGRAETPDAEEAACEYLAPLHQAGVQSIILGCTHFPFLLPVLHRAICRMNDPGFHPTFVDPSEEAVRVAASLIDFPDSNTAPVHFAATGDPDAFRRYASSLLSEPIPPVTALVLET